MEVTHMGKRVALFAMLFFMAFHAVCRANDYTSHWAAEAITGAMRAGIAAGDPSGDFRPDDAVSRAEFVTFLAKTLRLQIWRGAATFTDVDAAAWYYPYVSAAEQYGLVSGYADGSFRPAEPLSRQDAVAILCRAYKTPLFHEQEILINYSDFRRIAAYSANYMAYAVSERLLTGYADGTLRPEQSMTRAEALALINRFDTYFASVEASTPAFLFGYPKTAPTGAQNKITLTVRTNIPCNVYYKLIKAEDDTSILPPAREQISTLLVPVTVANTDFLCTIDAEPNTRYNLYLVAVANGVYGETATLKNIAPMPYTMGTGSADRPYIISNELQLDQIRNFPDKHFRLDADIALTGEWEPIGSVDEQGLMFTGSLDGNGHRITNLSIDGDGQYVGLFAYLFGATVKNLSVDANIAGKSDVGIIAGHAEGATIENCYTSGFVSGSGNNTGGIVGTNFGVIRNCMSTVYVVESMAYAGGIAGRNLGDIENCLSASHSVSADMYAGGIAGANIGGRVQNCVAANMHVADVLTSNTGRITTNRQNGTTVNNYGYNRMRSNSSAVQPGADGQDGADVAWDALTGAAFYEDPLGWDFASIWRRPDKQTDSFLLPSLKALPAPELEAGYTIYQPIRISTAAELRQINDRPDAHFILAANITLPHSAANMPNLQLCPLTENPEEGFSGSLDGNGYTISNLYIPLAEDGSAEGLFGSIADGGIVRNLNLKNADVTGSSNTGILAAVNYGSIENCTVDGVITAYQYDRPANAGGVCGMNYGTLDNVESTVNIHLITSSSTAGGVAAQNEGIINNAAYAGTITAESKGNQSNAVIGGIAGINTDGFIYNAYANATVRAQAFANYTGGICGIQNSGELYKCSSKGRIYAQAGNSAPSAAYTGGIAGLSAGGLVMHSFSAAGLTASANDSYTGGIVGYNGASTIQNTYATGAILQTGGIYRADESQVFAGGIVGCNETGFINGAVALNPYVKSNGASGRICAKTPEGNGSDNYAYDNMDIALRDAPDCENGTVLPAATLKNASFFTTPIGQGGLLGWSSVRDDPESGVWTDNVLGAPNYTLPLLDGVKYQNTFTMPNIR